MHETVRDSAGETAVTEAMRHSLRSKIAHAAELLHSQGPVSTYTAGSGSMRNQYIVPVALIGLFLAASL